MRKLYAATPSPKRALLLSCVAFIFALGSNPAGLAQDFLLPAAVNEKPAFELWESRVFVDRCPTEMSDTLAPAVIGALPIVTSILSFLVPRAIDFGVSVVNQKLQERKKAELDKNKPITISAIAAVDAFFGIREGRALNNEPPGKLVVTPILADKCLIYVRGNFSKPPTNAMQDCQQFLAPAHKQPLTCAWLHQKGLFAGTGADRGIGVYLESKFVFSEDGTSFRIVPQYLAYAKRIGAELGTYGRFDLTFAVNFESPSAGQVVTPFGLTILAFQQLREGTYLDKAALSGKTSGWTPVPGLNAAQVEELKRLSALFGGTEGSTTESPSAKAEKDTWRNKVKALGYQPVAPITVRVALTEQPYLPTNVLLLTLADAFEESKGELASVLQLNAMQALGLDREAQLKRIEDNAQLEIAALQQLDVFQTAKRAVDALAADAPDDLRQAKILALNVARINLDVACSRLEDSARARVCPSH